MKRVMTACLLACLALPAAPRPVVADDFLVFRCNQKIPGSGSFQSGLRVIFPSGRFRHNSGEDGLSRRVAFDGARAVAWVRTRYPELTAGGRGYYNQNCGMTRDNENE